MYDYVASTSAALGHQYGSTMVASPTSYAPYGAGQLDFRPDSPTPAMWPGSGDHSWDQSYHNSGPSDASADASPESVPRAHKLAKRKDAPSPRKRISRACDQCNQLRTKCDGEKPCAHCICT